MLSYASSPSIQEILLVTMSGAFSPNLTISLNQKSLRFPATIRPAGRFSTKTVKCAAEGDGESGKLKGVLSNMVGERVEELLNKEENKELLDKLNAASERVEKARNELAEIERQELEARVMKEYIQKMEARAAEIAECQREVEEAKAMVEEAELVLSDVGSAGEGNERLESVKAALISALIGTVASLPITLVHSNDLPHLLLPLSITFASCALFGVTFRYAVRRDLNNFQLKTGTSAAFGFVKGLGTLNGGPPLELNTESFVSHAMNGALLVSQELVVFLFAAVGLDLCFKLRFLSPFPIGSSNEETEQR